MVVANLPAAAARDGAVGVDISDPVCGAAVTASLAAAGVELVDRPTAEIVISDRLEGERLDVLVAPMTAVALTDAARAFYDGRIRCVVSAERPDDVAHALALLASGRSVLPSAVQAAIGSLPPLTDRERRVWQAVLAGQPTIAIARALGVSLITVKRDVAALCRKAQVSSRCELWAVGERLGFEPVRVRL